MNIFFHNYPTCPSCLSPHDGGTVILTNKRKNSFKCTKCGTHFYNKISIPKRKKSELLWKINLNSIERSYVSFLNKKPKGKYLITWPWDNVKFSPILVANYLLKNKNDKAVIIDRLMQKPKDSFYSISPDIIFDYLNVIDSKILKNVKEDKNINFNEKIFENRQKFYCDVTIIKRNLKFYKNFSGKKITFIDNKFRLEVDSKENDFKKFRKEMEKTIIKLYGKDSIYSIRAAHENKLPKKIDEYGIFILYFNTDEGIDASADLNKDFEKDLSQLVQCKEELQKVSDEIKYISIHNEAELNKNLEEYNLIFIDETINSKKIFDTLSNINPNLTIFNRADFFFERTLFFNKGFEFNTFLKNTRQTVLLFSTYRDDRYFYKIGDETSILNELNILPHTWDFNEILSKIPIKNEISSPCSSKVKQIKPSNEIKCEYLEVNELTTIEEVFSDIINFYGSNNQIKNFLRSLIKTPLYKSGSYSDKKVFRRYNLNMNSLISIIYNRDEELGTKLDEIFNKIYMDDKNNNENPLLNKLISTISELNVNRRDKILIIVDKYEIKGLNEIIKEKFENNPIIDAIEISSWDEIQKYVFKDNLNYYMITTSNPYIGFKLNEHKIKKMYFIGSPSIISDLKVMMTKRLTDMGTKPIFLLNENDKAPTLLKKSMQKIENLPEITKFEANNLNSKLNYTYEKPPAPKWTTSIKQTNRNQNNKYNLNIHKNENAVLVISRDGQGMFLPLNNRIYIKNLNDGVDEITVGSDTCNDLINKEIVLDNEGFYTSFRLIFFNFILDYGKNIPILTQNYNWDDFKVLMKDAFNWLDILQDILKKHYSENEKQVHLFSPKYRLALDISKLNLNAKNPNYLEKIWLSEPIFLESTDEIPIFETERPKSINDLIKLYEWINNEFSDMNLTSNDARKTFDAAILIQKIRRDFLHKKTRNIQYNFKGLYKEFEDLFDKVLLNAESFEVLKADIVTLNKEVVPYKSINNYKEYI